MSQVTVARRANLVRERLLDRIAARWDVPVTVVSAPAGYGKTTLLRQAVEANAAAPLGVDLLVRCTPVCRAVSSLAAVLYRAVEVPPCQLAGAELAVDIEDIAATVVDAVWRRAPQPVALLIDDVHEVPPGSDAAALIVLVATLLPSNGHLVLCGRSAPPLPRTRLEVEDRLVVIDRDDLAFTPVEATAFAALRGASSDTVASCGGWPGLAELSARPGANRAQDYVGEEVLGWLTPAEQQELALLSHVGSFDEDQASPSEIVVARRRAAEVLVDRGEPEAAVPC